MVSDGHVKELQRLLAQGKSLAASARMTEMSEKTARDYRDDQRLPSQRKQPRNYRTRVDPFAKVWPEVERRLQAEPRLQAYTLFEWLQANHPGEFASSTRRTFERRVSKWQALRGPGKPVFFEQRHEPGRLAASDFTVCNELNVKIAGHRFDHCFYHCVLTYSNTESVSLCFSESFEALSEGIQKAFWEFGGVPLRHRTDSLSAAVNNHSSRKSHTARYTALMDHYGCQPERTNARCANENGDVESSNRHFKNRLDQALLLRGSRDFASRQEYVTFVEQRVAGNNGNRQEKLVAEQVVLQSLPDQRLDTADVILGVRVSKGSTIQVRTNTYSIPSRLIGKRVDVRIEAEQIEVTHGENLIQTMPRVYGKHGASINYRHIIDSLVRKPGAFASYRYREELFPTSQFRIAYDILLEAHSQKVADKQYVKILELAARESQSLVEHALRLLIKSAVAIDVDVIEVMVQDAASLPPATAVEVKAPDLNEFDTLFTTFNQDDKEVISDEQNENSNHENVTDQNSNSESDESPSLSRADIIDRPEATSPPRLSQTEPGRPAEEPGLRADAAVSGVADAELSRSLHRSSDAGSTRRLESFGLSFGADDARMRIATGGPNQTRVRTIKVTAGQELELVRLPSLATVGDATNGDTQGRFVFEPTRERAVVRETGLGEKSCVVCVGGAVDLTRTHTAVHDMRDAGSAVVDCQAGLAAAEAVQATVELRGADHRRSRICAAESRGDGSSVHVAGRALRTGQRVADQQPSVQQVGSDFQRHHDDRSSNRSLGSPQRDHRNERPQLSHRDRQESKVTGQPQTRFQEITNYFPGNSNCR
jgi:hypothetical protein